MLYFHLAHRLQEQTRFAAAILHRIRAMAAEDGWQPDVVQAHDTHALFAGAAIARSLAVPLVYDAVEIPEHATRSASRPRWSDASESIIRALERPLLSEAARVLTVGETLADWYQAHHVLKAPVTVVHNSRYLWTPAPDNRLREDCGIGPDVPLLLWIGGAAPHRGMEFVAEALPRLPGYHAAFITEFKPFWEDYRRELLALIKTCGVEQRLHILPMRSPNDLIPYASGADIGLIPFSADAPLNVRYSLPNKFFEMVMARLPIAATPLDNVGQLIRRLGNGIEISASPVEAAVPIQALYAGRRAPGLQSSLERAARELCWEHGQKALTDLYRELAAGRR